MISKEDLHDDGNNYLDCRAMKLDQKIEKVALCLDAVVGYTKVAREPFVRFMLKDRNGSTISARIFGVEKKSTGFVVSSYKNIPVKVRATVSEFNGLMTLVVEKTEDIQKLPVSGFDYKPFLGELKLENEKFLVELYEKFGLEFPVEYKTASLLSIFDGRVSGFAKLVELTIYELYKMKTLPGFDATRIIRSYLLAIKYYYKKLKKEQEIEILSNFFLVELVSQAKTEFSEHQDKTLILDMIMSLCDLTKPEQLGSIIVHHLTNTLLQSFRLLGASCITLPGTRTVVGSDTLLNG